MKQFTILVTVLFFISCSGVRLVKDWKNPETDIYVPTKVFVVGLASHQKAQVKFEEKIQDAFTKKGIEVVTSRNFSNPDLTSTKQTEEQLNTIEKMLLEDGFDTILFSKITRVEDRVKYRRDYYNEVNTNQNFKDEYLSSQNFFFNKEYNQAYKVYHLETSLFCICPTKERELLWKGYIEITDSKSIDKTIQQYVKLILKQLESQQLIPAEVSE